MHFKAFVALSIASAVTAVPATRRDAGNVCCNSVTSASSAAATKILKSIGVDVSDVTGLVGLTCTTVNVLGNSATCGSSQTEVTCQDNSHGGLIALGCVPVTLRRRQDDCSDESSWADSASAYPTDSSSPGSSVPSASASVSNPESSALSAASAIPVTSVDSASASVATDASSVAGAATSDVSIDASSTDSASSSESTGGVDDGSSGPTDTGDDSAADGSSTGSTGSDSSSTTNGNGGSGSGYGSSSSGNKNPGPRCCNSVVSPNSSAAAGLLGSLGIVVQDLVGSIGLGCTGVTVLGNSNTCGSSQTQVNCQDNSHGSLISISCIPITL